MAADTWDEIRTAYQVARLGTVSGAAEVLGVHHATVIRHVDALEKRLGTRLFQRHARGYTPTEAGRDLLSTAERTEEQLAQLVSRIKGQGETVSGELVVTSIAGLATLLTPVFREFAEAHPSVRITHVSDMRLFRLDFGEAHVAIRAGAAPQEPDYVVQPLTNIRYGLFAAPDYIAARGLPGSEADFPLHRFVGPADPASRAPFHRWLRSAVPDEAVVHRVSEPQANHSAICGGLGIGFLPVREAEALGLTPVLEPHEDWVSSLWIVTHVDLHRTPKVQGFLAVLKRISATWSCT